MLKSAACACKHRKPRASVAGWCDVLERNMGKTASGIMRQDGIACDKSARAYVK
ncbi:hypothetical protein NRB_17490 [Novosphingobium sp. 11B]